MTTTTDEEKAAQAQEIVAGATYAQLAAVIKIVAARMIELGCQEGMTPK